MNLADAIRRAAISSGAPLGQPDTPPSEDAAFTPSPEPEAAQVPVEGEILAKEQKMKQPQEALEVVATIAKVVGQPRELDVVLPTGVPALDNSLMRKFSGPELKDALNTIPGWSFSALSHPNMLFFTRYGHSCPSMPMPWPSRCEKYLKPGP